MLVNLTPHQINLYTAETPDEVKQFQLLTHKGFIKTLQSVGNVRVPWKDEVIGNIENIPIVKMVYTDAVALPDPVEGVTYIVSQIAARGIKRSDVVFPHRLVRDETGAIVGCRAFSLGTD